MTRHVALEIAVQDVAGARVAADGGAQRVELCAALAGTGGLTPSAGLVAAVARVLDGTDTGLHVLIRPRAGGFVYDDDEVAVQVRDIMAVLDAGADGVVVGMLTSAGAVDARALVRVADAAEDAEVTFHRAFDVTAARDEALHVLAQAGVRRVLTSAGAPTAPAGIAELRRLAPLATAAGIDLMAGGGVTPGDIPALVDAGVHAVHLSARRTVAEAGGPGGGSGGYDVTDPAIVEAAAAALRG